MNRSHHTPVVVLGAGLAGLTASLRLAQNGHTVTVYESRNHVGGQAATIVKDGFHLNQGPHALYLGGAADIELRSLGIALSGRKPDTTSARIVRNGSLELAPGSAIGLLRTKALPSREKPAIASLLARLGHMRADDFAGVSTSNWIDSAVGGEASRALLNTLARVVTYSAIPEQLSAQIFIEQMQLSLRGGVVYLNNGWSQITCALMKLIDETGLVKFDFGAAAEMLPDAPAVIIATGSARRAGQLLQKTFDVGPAADVSCLDLGVRVRPTHDVVFSADEPLYFSNHSAAALLAPADQWLVSAAQYLGPDDEPNEALLEKFVRFVGVNEHDVVMRRRLHRMTAVSSLPTANLGGLAGRPRVTDTGHDNVFVAGDWVGPAGHLADASVASGCAAANAALAHLERAARVTSGAASAR